MGKLYHFIDVEKIKNDFGIKNLVETGTSDGVQFFDYLKFNFDDYYSCEIIKEQYDIAVRNIGHIKNIHITNQSSVNFLSELLPKIKDIPTIFWLDAHLPGSEIGLPLSYEKDRKLRMPLEDEIFLLHKLKNTKNDVILCDDLRHYEDGNYESGNWVQRKDLGGDSVDFIYEYFKDTHNIIKNYNYGGCVILTPKKTKEIGVVIKEKLIDSLGDSLGLTPVIEELYSQDKTPVIVSTLLPEIYLNNPYVGSIVNNISPSISLIPCLSYSCNIAQNYAKQLNIELPKDVKPKIYLSSCEKDYGKSLLTEFDGFKKIAVSLTTSADCRCLRYGYISRLLNKLKQEGYKLIGIGQENFENGYEYDKSFINLTTIREAAAILNACDLYLGVDSGLYHLAAAVGVPQIVFFRHNDSSNNRYSNTFFIDSKIKCGDICLTQHLSKCNVDVRCMDSFDLDEYHKLVIKTLPLYKKKSCYVINFFLGDRRFDIHTYQTDKLCYLKYQIETLQKYKHSLSKIVFNFNVEPDHYNRLNDAINIIPKRIQNTDVEINIRKNYGLSYGAFSDIFKKYMDNYDYYIFNEDDYVIVQDNFDEYMVNKFDSLPNCGYLCGLVRETSKFHQKHAGMSSGISSYEVLKKIYDLYGELPHAKTTDYSNNECYSQVEQSNAMVKLGYEIYDIREEYRLQMKSAEKIDGHNLVHRYFMWHDTDLFLSTNLYLNEFSIWMDRIDEEYLRMDCNTKSTKHFKYGE